MGAIFLFESNWGSGCNRTSAFLSGNAHKRTAGLRPIVTPRIELATIG